MAKYKTFFAYALIVAAIAVAVLNFAEIWKVIFKVLRAFSPLFVGGIVALALNPLYDAVRNKVLGNVLNKRCKKLKKPLSALITCVLFFGLIAGLVALVLPALAKSLSGFAENAEDIIASAKESDNALLAAVVGKLFGDGEGLKALADKLVPDMLGFTKKAIRATVNGFLGIIISIYLLYNKELLAKQTDRLLQAILPCGKRRRLIHLAAVFGGKFSGFMFGQLVEAVLLGVACYAGMQLLGLPYAVLISVMVGALNVIPILGSYLAGVPAALLIFMISPTKALVFIVFICILQQVEAVTTYPKIVGKTVGLSGLWILVSVAVFGSLFGIVGIILGVPVTAGFYHLVKTAVDIRIKEKSLKP